LNVMRPSKDIESPSQFIGITILGCGAALTNLC
jgi:hypothetical protein